MFSQMFGGKPSKIWVIKHCSVTFLLVRFLYGSIFGQFLQFFQCFSVLFIFSPYFCIHDKVFTVQCKYDINIPYTTNPFIFGYSMS